LPESNYNRLFHRRDPVLIYAVMQGDESIVRLLLEYGADANAQTANYEFPEYDALATLWAVLIFQPNT
jgi:ankyrin repeat protein